MSSRRIRPYYRVNFNVNKSVLFPIMLVLILVNIYYSIKVASIISAASSAAAAFADIRQSELQGESLIGDMSFFINANQLLFGLACFGYITLQKVALKATLREHPTYSIKHTNANKYICLSGVYLSLLVSLLDGSRAFFLNALLTFLFAVNLLKLISLNKIFFIVIGVLLLFSLTFSIFRPEVDGFNDGIKYTALYLSGGIGSLDYVLRGEAKVYWQDYESLANKLSLIGLPFGGYDLKELRMDFVDLADGYQTNVYTALGVYYEYMGAAIIFFSFIVGAAMKYFSWLSKKGAVGLYLYSFFLSAMVLSIFHDYFLSTTYFMIKIFILLALIKIIDMALDKFLSQLKINLAGK